MGGRIKVDETREILKENMDLFNNARRYLSIREQERRSKSKGEGIRFPLLREIRLNIHDVGPGREKIKRQDTARSGKFYRLPSVQLS